MQTTESILIDETLTQQNTDTLLKLSQRQLAFNDIIQGFLKWRVWLMLAYQDLKLRYRRSVLGPFWITISMAVTVYSMGYLYSHLFHTDLQTYFPFLVAGMIAWTLISTLITDVTEALYSSDGLIKQIKLPYCLYIQRVVTRNIIAFFHNIVVIIPIIAIFHQVAKVNFYTLLIIPGLFLIYINALAYGLMLAMIGARFRDLVQVIKNLTQVAFFLTPVMWNPQILPEKDRFIVMLNPFYSFVELIRAPLMGAHPAWTTFAMVSVVTFIGIALCLKMFTQYRARIIYWL